MNLTDRIVFGAEAVHAGPAPKAMKLKDAAQVAERRFAVGKRVSGKMSPCLRDGDGDEAVAS